MRKSILLFLIRQEHLTTGIPKIQRIISYEGYDDAKVLRNCSLFGRTYLSSNCDGCCSKKAEDEGIEHEEMHRKLTHVASKELSSIDGKRVVIGSLELLEEEQTFISEQQKQVIEEKYSQMFNLLYLSYDGKLIAIFLIDTPLTLEAIELVHELKERGKQMVLLTENTQNVMETICSLISFDKVYTQVKPEQSISYSTIERSRLSCVDDWRRN